MKHNQIKMGVVLSYVLLASNIVVGLIYTPFMLKLMGKSEYGLYSLASSVVGYLTILDFGFGTAIVRYSAKYHALNKKNEEYNLYGLFLILYLLIAVLAVIGGTFLYFNIDRMFSSSLTAEELGKIKIIMLLLIFNLAIAFPFGIFSSIITAYENFIFVKSALIVQTLLNPLIMIPLLLQGYKAIGMVVVTTILNIFFYLANLIYCFFKLGIKIRFCRLNVPLLKEIVQYSFFVFLILIMDKINWSTDQFILGILKGTAEVSVYSVAVQLNAYYLSFSSAITGILLPRLTTMVTKNATDTELSDLFIRVGRIQYCIVMYVLSGFILFGQNFMRAWTGKEYFSAYYIALFLMIPVTVPLIQSVGMSILQAQNRQKFSSLVYCGIALLNVLISIQLGKIFGGIGCAIGTALALIFGQILTMNLYYYKKVHINIPRFWKEIGRMTLPVVLAVVLGVGICAVLPYEGYFWLVVKIAGYSLIYLPLMWRWGMNEYEKNLFLQPAQKIMNNRKIFSDHFLCKIRCRSKSENKKDCTGCTACCALCPKKCIQMETDSEGFWYPQVDNSQCVNCGLCKERCPARQSKNKKDTIKAYAAFSNNEEIRSESSSGGLFTPMAEYILENGGIVFGAEFDADFNVRHRYVETKKELEFLRGSKYVQSRIGQTYAQAKAFLDQERPVLFSGTPCQIAGLRSYLNKEYPNLFCQDILCHGVPSPLVWQKYLEHRQQTSHSSVSDVSFRKKTRGWKQFSVSLTFGNGMKQEHCYQDDLMMKAFLSNLCLRPSCYHCPFKGENSESDITLGDFWGIETVLPDMDDDKGTSLVFVRSENGKKLWNAIQSRIVSVPVSYNDAVSNNSAAFRSVEPHKRREMFFRNLSSCDFDRLIDRCCSSPLMKLKKRIKGCLKKEDSR